MNLRNIRYKKRISFLIIFFIFLSSICNFQNDTYQKKGINDVASTQNELSAYSSDTIEIMFVEEQIFSTYNFGLLRNSCSKERSYGIVDAISVLFSIFIICAGLLFSYIQMKDIENSHKYIIHYIHQKDGLK